MAAGRRLRVATFNLLHGISLPHGQVREEDLRSSAARLDVDVVGLQEVDRGQQRSGSLSQAQVFADAMPANHVRYEPSLHAVPAAFGWRMLEPSDDGPAYGLATVSRHPVRRWKVHRFDKAPIPLPLKIPGRKGLVPVADEPRLACAAVLDLDGDPARPVTVVNTHLSFVPGWNVAQVRAISRWARRFPAPRILVGDLNLPGGIAAAVTGWSRLARVPTYPSWGPRIQFDHVLADGIAASAVRDVEVLRLDVSDHCAVVVEVELPG